MVRAAHLKLDIWQQFARFDEQTAALQLRHFMRPQPCTPEAHSQLSPRVPCSDAHFR